MKKAQVSIEIIVFISFVILLFASISIFSFNKKQEIDATEDYLNLRNECLRVSNILSGVSSGGDGTSAVITTPYLISVYNHSYVGIKEVQNITEVETKIAILVSEAGESTQVFYDTLNARFNPQWYKNCFSDIDSSGCQSSGTNVDYNLIPLNLNNLICNDLYNYNVIYLEDAHIQYNAVCSGSITYLQRLQDWVDSGNTIILAEHTMCREQGGSGSYPSTSYRCNPSGYNSDVWTIFNNKLHQKGGSYGNNVNIVIDPDPELFPSLDLNDTFDFEEPSYIEETIGMLKESESLSLSGGFSSSTSCICSSPSGGRCIRHTGSLTTQANATWTSNITGEYEIKFNYCGENDGNDNWFVYKNNQIIDYWNTSGGEPNWRTRSIQDVQLSSGDILKFGCKRGNSNTYCRSDYFKLVSPADPSMTVVGKYESTTNPAIAYWNYGSGKVFYFGDFQVVSGQQSFYSQVISELIENVYLLLFGPDYGEEICFPNTYIRSIGSFSGTLKMTNINNELTIKNV